MNYEKDNLLWESHVVTLKNYVKKDGQVCHFIESREFWPCCWRSLKQSRLTDHYMRLRHLEINWCNNAEVRFFFGCLFREVSNNINLKINNIGIIINLDQLYQKITKH